MSVREYLDRLLVDARVIEVRLFGNGPILSGLFDDADALEAVVAAHPDRDIYSTVQRPHDSLQATNEVARGGALKDADIGHLVRVVFDIDAVRASSEPASESQLRACGGVADNLVRLLSAQGWPLPARVASGNGFHLHYRTQRRAVTAEHMAALKAMYRGMQKDFSDSLAKFDAVVHNASRIMRLPGTFNHKGEPRPATVEVPPRWNQVTAQQVEHFAQTYVRRDRVVPFRPKVTAPVAAGRGNYATLDVIGWFDFHGHYVRHLDGLVHAVICPWQEEHTSPSPQTHSDSIVFAADGGWPGFFCHHNHCEGRRIQDVMALWGDQDGFCTQRYGS